MITLLFTLLLLEKSSKVIFYSDQGMLKIHAHLLQNSLPENKLTNDQEPPEISFF